MYFYWTLLYKKENISLILWIPIFQWFFFKVLDAIWEQGVKSSESGRICKIVLSYSKNIESDVVFHGLFESNVEISISVVLIRKIDEIQHQKVLLFKKQNTWPPTRYCGYYRSIVNRIPNPLDLEIFVYFVVEIRWKYPSG
jgi:hypothetical protein